jgi:predicted molibdopterin-dependent oxidoreductase YjgC
MRIKPRPNPEVNAHWMCDYGRLNYEWINRGARIEAPMVKEGEKFVALSWADALTRLAAALKEAGGETRAVVSPFMANEDLGLLRRVMEATGGGNGVYRCPTGEEVVLPGFPTLALRTDRAANSNGADLLGYNRVGDRDGVGGLEQAAAHGGVLWVLGDELADAPETFGTAASVYVYVGHFLSPAARNAHFVLPATTFAEMEGTFTNVQKRVQRFWPALQAPGMARPAWQILGVLLAGISDAAPAGTAADAFASLASVRPEFGALAWAELGQQGAPLPSFAETGD